MLFLKWAWWCLIAYVVKGTTASLDSNRQTACPDGFTEFCYSTDCGCYIYVPFGLSWDEAKDFCYTQHNSDLTSIHSDWEDEFLWGLIASDSIPDGIWIGATRNDKLNFTFKWVDDSCFDYGDFQDGNPDNINNNQHCIRLIGPADPQFTEPHKWDDYNCGALFASFCKLRSGPSTGTTSTGTTGTGTQTVTIGPGGTTQNPGGTTVLPNCEAGWRPFCHSQGCHCYTFVTAKMAWTVAENHCVDILGGHLASVHSIEENRFLHQWLDESGATVAFIGLNKIQVFNVWSWSDGTTLDYEQWGPNEPNCGGCLAGASYYLYEGWNDQEETTPQSFFCKKLP